jgi:hypothetical protein
MPAWMIKRLDQDNKCLSRAEKIRQIIETHYERKQQEEARVA